MTLDCGVRMLFASVSLAARIERAECRLLTDGIDAALRHRPKEGGVQIAISGGAATVELSNLADASIGAFFTKRGYVLRGFENVLGRPLSVADSDASDVSVEVALDDSDDSSSWLDIIVSGFAVPDDQGVPSGEEFPREIMEGVLRDMAAAAGFVRYLAQRDGAPVGAVRSLSRTCSVSGSSCSTPARFSCARARDSRSRPVRAESGQARS